MSTEGPEQPTPKPEADQPANANSTPESKPEAQAQPAPTPAKTSGDKLAKDTTASDAFGTQAEPNKTATEKKVENETGWREIVSKIFGVLLWPFIFLFRPLIFRVTKEHGNPKVHFTSFSALFYLWPVMVVGWLGVLLDDIIRPEVLGWAWITTLLLVMITIATDIDRNKLIGLVLIVGLCWAVGFILQSNQDIPVLSGIYGFFASQEVQFNAGMANVISIIILIILMGVIGYAWVDGRYEITTREITHRKMLRTSDSLPRAAKRIKQDWRDIAELIIGLGAGDVIVLDTQKNIIMRIPNVPFLWFFRHDVDHVLEVIATTDVHEIAAVIEEEEF